MSSSFTAVTVKSVPLSFIGSRSINFSNFGVCRIAVSTIHAFNCSQRVSNLPQDHRNFAHVHGTWMRPIVDEDDDDDDENEEDRSLDLLVRFIQNVFKKVSKKARKAVRSVIPFPISTQLLGFSVNGILVLTFLWILKAFLEVVCTLGSVVFVSILSIRGIWYSVRFLQERGHQKMDELDVERNAWNGAQPVT